MGMVEEKIKRELLQSIYADTIKIFEFIESRFELSDSEQKGVITTLNALNDELSRILKDAKLS